jgi:hypothetical protein
MPAAARKREAPASSSAAGANPAESPLAWLRRRKDRDGAAMISQVQFDAGERLRADFWFGQMTPRVTMSWSTNAPAQRRRRSGMAFRSDADMTDNVAAARERVRRALAAVGPELSGILIDVCCHLKGLEEAERTAGWPQRSGKVVLQLALTRLARHYGIGTSQGAREACAGPLRHWGSEDYRPLFELPAE